MDRTVYDVINGKRAPKSEDGDNVIDVKTLHWLSEETTAAKIKAIEDDYFTTFNLIIKGADNPNVTDAQIRWQVNKLAQLEKNLATLKQ